VVTFPQGACCLLAVVLVLAIWASGQTSADLINDARWACSRMEYHTVLSVTSSCSLCSFVPPAACFPHTIKHVVSDNIGRLHLLTLLRLRCPVIPGPQTRCTI
jgi:hypothetical protein